MKTLAFCGSLRKEPFNRKAINAAIALTPDGMTIDAYEELGNLPPYNEDVRQRGYPSIVQELRGRVAAADAVLFVTPEYNYSIPGVLKNAIDWVSRPTDQPFDGKPCAIMGAYIGMIGRTRAQYHLRQMCVFLNMHPIDRPEVMIPMVQDRFNEAGSFTDEVSKKFIRQLLENLVDWTEQLKR